jgi:LPXTG-motif cell wall-anchored protein
MVLMLAACQEVTLQTAPEALAAANKCPGEQNSSNAEQSGPWGTIDGTGQALDYQINDGYTVGVCIRQQNDTFIADLSGSGTLEVGPGFNHWTITDISGGGTTVPAPTEPTTTTTEPTTTATEPTTTTTAGDTTTTLAATTLTEAEVTTTAAGGVTTTAAGGVTTTAAGGVTTTAAGGVTTTTDGGGPVDPGQVTTTAAVGGGTLEPGQEATTTTGEGGGTGEGEETSTTGDEVEGGSADTLPYTGAGDMTMGGLAGMLLAAGIVLLLLTRKRSGAE